MIIVTAGRPYLDIDAYASCIAYKQLLEKQGQKVDFVSTSPPNYSIPKSHLLPIKTNLPEDVDPLEIQYAFLDVSDPASFELFAPKEQITEVYDHRPGYEEYWKDFPYIYTQIEQVGSVCTQIFEKWQDADLLPEMPKNTAELLMFGILDNTLNFKATITSERDIKAYTELCAVTESNGQEFAENYFKTIQVNIEENIAENLKKDTKSLKFKTYNEQVVIVGQLAVWDKNELGNDFERALYTIYPKDSKWFINVIDLASGKSYFLTSDASVTNWLGSLLLLQPNRHFAEADRLWLRKEIIAVDINKSKVYA